MFPDIVQVSDLDQSKIELGDNYLVAPLKKVPRTYNQKNQLVGKFKGLNALFEYQEKFQAEAKRGKSSDTKRGSKKDGFYHFNSFKEAVDVYLNDPQSVVDFIEADMAIEGGDSAGRELIYDVTGDFLDIGRFIEGEPENFGSLTNGNPRNKRVNIIMDASWNWDTHKDFINLRSSRIIRLVDWLESQNIRTSVTAVLSDACCHMEIVVKQFDEPLDLNDIAIVGHSDFLRRITFRFIEYSETYSSGYGNSVIFSRKFKASDWEPDYNEEYSVFIAGGIMNGGKDSLNTAFDKAETQLSKLLAEDYSAGRVLKVLETSSGGFYS